MAKKIEGWNYEDERPSDLEISHYRDPVGKYDYPEERPATLVIHDGDEHERVFTESEVMAAAMAVPVLPDAMPDEMWEACKSNRAIMEEAMRVAVRLTRDGILGRLLDPSQP